MDQDSRFNVWAANICKVFQGGADGKWLGQKSRAAQRLCKSATNNKAGGKTRYDSLHILRGDRGFGVLVLNARRCKILEAERLVSERDRTRVRKDMALGQNTNDVSTAAEEHSS